MVTLRRIRGSALAAAGCTLLVATLAACGQSARAEQPSASPLATAGTPGRATVRGPGIDMEITSAVAHVDPSGDGSLTMIVRSREPVPDHLDLAATPDSGRGELVGAAHGVSGSMESAGILVPAGATVRFGTTGPQIRLHRIHGVTAHGTLPVSLEFGVAGLVRLEAVVQGT